LRLAAGLIPLLLGGCGPLAGLDPVADCDRLEDFGWEPGDGPVESDLLAQTNAVRAAGATCDGVAAPPAPPLSMDARLQCAARRHALDMATSDFFAHESPTTGSVADRADDAGYAWGVVGENIAAGQPKAEDALADWVGSTTGHCENLMAPEFVDAGMGLARAEDSEFPTWWVQVFAAPL
jgi:uncharacterized protein YkwD